MDTAQSILGLNLNLNLTNPSYPENLHILSGSFRSISLFLLVFSPIKRTLELVKTIDGFGPHQYLGLNERKDRVYATSWAEPPELSSWEVGRVGGGEEEVVVEHINNVPITATSSYVTIPPPYTHVYSTGGPTGEIHTIDPITGGFGERVQQFLFVDEDKLDEVDKTRVALRYGSHAIEFSIPLSLAFIPVLGTNTIEVYTYHPNHPTNPNSPGPHPHLTHTKTTHSPRGPSATDGPRHLKVHPNGKMVYCITEHSNYLDAYEVRGSGSGSGTSGGDPELGWVGSRDVVPRDSREEEEGKDGEEEEEGGKGGKGGESGSEEKYRGDTLMLTPSTPTHPTPHTIWATTRGKTESDKGFISVFRIDDRGYFVDPGDSSSDSSASASASESESESESESVSVERYETPTSGGKAHAIDLYPKTTSDSELEGAVWILLTDDSDYAATSRVGVGVGGGGGAVRVLEWDGWGTGGIREVVGWPEPGSLEIEKIRGASHAVWLD